MSIFEVYPSWILLCGVTAIVTYALILIRRRYIQNAKAKPALKSHSSPTVLAAGDKKLDMEEAYRITSMTDFDWQTTEPLKFQTFKPKYHITMGIQESSFNELIEMDCNYLSRIQLRKQIIADHHDITIQASSKVKPAIDELYIWLTNKYLPTRFPTMFQLTTTSLYNQVTSQHLPLSPPLDSIRTLEILGENLDDDIIWLLPSEDGDQYQLEAFVTCFPAGFNTKEKFGMKLRDIHRPVPGYKEKLEKSMDRFFDKLEVGRVVKRSNWTIATHGRLFAASGSHLYEGDEVKEEEIDIDTTFLRCERQLLHRLPKSRALVFSIKTYLYPILDIKEEGLGEELAQAIDGLKHGNVPAIHFYKRGVVWGEAVKAYLRS